MLMAALAASSPEELSWSMSANRGLTLACVPPAGALLSGGVTPIYACLYISINDITVPKRPCLVYEHTVLDGRYYRKY